MTCIFSSCLKENGKNSYSFDLLFNNGMSYSVESFLYEKKVTDPEVNQGLPVGSIDKNVILVKTNFENTIIEQSFFLFKIERRKLAGISDLYITDNSLAFMYGIIELKGDYKKSGRKVSVDNGTFTFDCNEATDASLVGQQLKGTWTLKRSN